jgi:hypothetical protein
MELDSTVKVVATIVLKLDEMDGGEETVPTHTNAAARTRLEVNG